MISLETRLAVGVLSTLTCPLLYLAVLSGLATRKQEVGSVRVCMWGLVQCCILVTYVELELYYTNVQYPRHHQTSNSIRV